MIEKIINFIENQYDKNRPWETSETPQVSSPFFKTLKKEGPTGAWNFLVEKEKDMGNPNIPPQLKALMNLLGSALLILGGKRMAKARQKTIEIKVESCFNLRKLTKYGDYFLRIIGNITLCLLFSSQGGGYVVEGFVNENGEKLYALLTPYEYKRVQDFARYTNISPKKALKYLYPHKIQPEKVLKNFKEI